MYGTRAIEEWEGGFGGMCYFFLLFEKSFIFLHVESKLNYS